MRSELPAPPRLPLRGEDSESVVGHCLVWLLPSPVIRCNPGVVLPSGRQEIAEASLFHHRLGRVQWRAARSERGVALQLFAAEAGIGYKCLGDPGRKNRHCARRSPQRFMFW